MTRVRRKRRSEKTQETAKRSSGLRQKEVDPVCCDTCLFMHETIAECRRMPPTVMVASGDDDELTCGWPPVEDDDWCGAWAHVETFEPLMAYLKHHKDAVAFGGGGDDEEEDDGEE